MVESDVNNKNTSFDEVDFVKPQDSVDKNINFNEPNDCHFLKENETQLSLVTKSIENGETLVCFGEERFLDVISEECSGDFESFQTPPTSIECTISNCSTMEDSYISEQSVKNTKIVTSNSSSDSGSQQEIQIQKQDLCRLETLENSNDVTSTTLPHETLITESNSIKFKISCTDLSAGHTNKQFPQSNSLKTLTKVCSEYLKLSITSGLASSSSLEPPACDLSEERLASASRVSLEPADVGRPLIDAGASTPQTRCAPLTTCSRESVADDSRVNSLQQEVKTPASTQKPADNNLNLPSFSINHNLDTSESCEKPEKTVSKCALTSDNRQNPGKTDDCKAAALCWGFKNGRLVFGESKSNSKQVVAKESDCKNVTVKETLQNTDDSVENSKSKQENLADKVKLLTKEQDILTSKDLNRRRDESRLKLLETKLQNAGINDKKLEKTLQSNSNISNNVENSFENSQSDVSKEISGNCKSKNSLKDQKTDLAQAKDKSNDNIYAHTQKNSFAEVNKFLETEKFVENKDCILETIFVSNNKELTGLPAAKLLKNHKYLAQDIEKFKNNLNKQVSTKLKFIDYNEFRQSSVLEKDQPSVDSNQNELKNEERIKNTDQEEDFIPDYGFLPENSHNFSEFNAHEVSTFPCNTNNVYQEFLEDSSSDSCGSECSCCSEEPQEHYIVISRKNNTRMRGDGSAVSDGEIKTHNPDKNNLKSLLKRSGGRKKDKNKNRVVFNEKKNEFFDADYIILIREECDFDEEEDDGVCTCNQHEMVRLTCCEPNCNCQFDGYDQTPPSPKFAPPIEFVDAVTLSPPEGYKDMELGEEQLLALQQMARRGQRGVVCKECSASHDEHQVDEEGECSLSEEGEAEVCQISGGKEEKEKTDQSQQTTPTTPPCSDSPDDQRNILNSAITTAQPHCEEERRSPLMRQPAGGGSPISGILKGGRLWKQSSSTDSCGIAGKGGEVQKNVPSSEPITSDDETSNRRSVRFFDGSAESKERRDVCDGAPQPKLEEEKPKTQSEKIADAPNKAELQSSTSPEEMTLTFKLGNHVLVSNNSLKPNSAVRQLFPNTKTLPAGGGEEEENSQQYLVTAESLRAFEDSKRAKLPQIVQSGEGAEDPFKRAIERNTLRRSLIRYEPRSKKQAYKTDNSLVERIKQLTCVDDNMTSVESDQQTDTSSIDQGEDVLDSRSSPPGEEARNSPDVNTLSTKSQVPEKSFSPSSSSTISSSSSSMSSASNYHHGQRTDNIPDIQNNHRREAKPLPDIGGPHHPGDLHSHSHYIIHPHQPLDHAHCAVTNKMSSSSATSESRRQFLSTLAPLTACVMGTAGTGAHGEDYYYSLSSQQAGERMSMASSAGTEYSLEDIDEGLKNQEEEEHRKIAPDVLAGTPSASESGDELALFVQQDMNRIERIKKKYQPDKDEDDEHDDYGFNRRPSVRGIKPRFGTTTEILQQIQNQLQPPPPPQAKAPAWSYYSESNLSDQSQHPKQNASSTYYSNLPAEEAAKARNFTPPQYRPTSLQDQESLYQNCTNQRCGSRQELYHSRNVNIYQSTVVRVGNEYYHSLPRQRNGRPQSPPPMEMAKSYHQTMVYIPYNHIEGAYQPVRYNYHPANAEYVSRVSSQNQINSGRRYAEPIYPKPHEYNQNNMIPPLPPKIRGAQAYQGTGGQPPPYLMAGSRSESPVPGQFSTARSTQTGHPATQQCAGYYATANPRYRPMINPVWPAEGTYANKMNRHSYPARLQDSSSLSTDSDSTSYSGSIPNGYNRASADMSNYATINPMSSPTKSRFIERGVPEGAASVSPQDLNNGGGNQTTSGTMTSPTSPQNPPTMQPGQKPMFYAMNV